MDKVMTQVLVDKTKRTKKAARQVAIKTPAGESW